VNELRTADLSIVKQLIRSLPKHPNFLQVTDSQKIKLPIENGNENSLLMKVVYEVSFWAVERPEHVINRNSS
jgi:hypothetical protein